MPSKSFTFKLWGQYKSNPYKKSGVKLKFQLKLTGGSINTKGKFRRESCPPRNRIPISSEKGRKFMFDSLLLSRVSRLETFSHPHPIQMENRCVPSYPIFTKVLKSSPLLFTQWKLANPPMINSEIQVHHPADHTTHSHEVLINWVKSRAKILWNIGFEYPDPKSPSGFSEIWKRTPLETWKLVQTTDSHGLV